MSKICLSFVFNHQFEENIPKLKSLYYPRFSTIRFLSPFSDHSENEEIIPIYETSVHFQGYFAQAYKWLPKNFDYYLFCGDDLILNPSLNEENIIKELNCENSSFIKYINPVWEHSFLWHKFNECNNFPNENCTVPYQQYFPDREELIKIYSNYGFQYRNLGIHNFFGNILNKGLNFKKIFAGLHYFFDNGLKRFVQFPLLEGYSDFIIIPKSELKSFCHFCGLFASMNLWVDAAIATALVLSSKSIKTEKDTCFRGTEIWDSDELDKKLKSTDYKIDKIDSIFERTELYIHPMKLSMFS